MGGKKMKKYAVYANIVNSLDFSGFTIRELDLFMAICSLQNGKASELCVYTFEALKDYLSWDKSQSQKVFTNTLKRVSMKMLDINGAFELGHEFFAFSLFSTFRVNEGEKTLTVRTNPDFVDLLNYFLANFTVIELQEYISLKSKYAKILYQHLRQYKSTRIWYLTTPELKKTLFVPKNYEMKKIMQRVITKPIEELGKLQEFKGIKVETFTEGTRNKIVGFQFTWEEADKPKYIKTSKAGFKENTYDFDELEKQLIAN